MQPENPLFTPPDKLKRQSGETIRKNDQLSREIDIINYLNDILSDPEASLHLNPNVLESTRFQSLSHLSSTRVIDKAGEDLLSKHMKDVELFDKLFGSPNLSIARPHETVPIDNLMTTPDINAETSVIQFVYSGNLVVYGIRVSTSVRHDDLPDINAPNASFDPDELRAVVIVSPTGMYVGVRNQNESNLKPTESFFVTATPSQRELVFNELDLAVKNLTTDNSSEN